MTPLRRSRRKSSAFGVVSGAWPGALDRGPPGPETMSREPGTRANLVSPAYTPPPAGGAVSGFSAPR
jgi:hypothetical protein